MALKKDALPATSGIATFLRARRGTLDDLSQGMVAVAGVPYDFSTTSRLGSRFAPHACRKASLIYQSYEQGGATVDINTREILSSELVREKLRDMGDITVFSIEWEKTEVSLRQHMYEIVRRGASPVIIGGDHFITYSLVSGFKDAVVAGGGKRVGYIQISSQLDLGDEDPVWGRVWRGATARRVMDSGAADTANMVWVGVNGYVRAEQWELAQELGLKVFTLNDIREQGIASVVQQAAAIAGDGCDSIYLSVDFDALDGGYVATTGAPSFDGISGVQLSKAMDILASSKVGALDLCGLNPVVEAKGQGETGQRLGVELVMRFVSSRIKDERG